MAKNGFCHVEWSCTDLEATKAFLWGLFGWEFQAFGEGYMLFSAPGGPGGGIMKVAEVKPGSSPTVYVEVDDVDSYLEHAVELGGGVVAPKKEIAGTGWYAHIADPDGNIIGVFQGKG